jgi:hypothetical protein
MFTISILFNGDQLMRFAHHSFSEIYASWIKNVEPLAQSVEQQPFKLWVVGSNPTRLTNVSFLFLSSSLVQDVALSRRKQGFESP